ncbi:hypothetical protein GCM10022224_099850 [Nonomuraea antimicrobica]|uniref:Beta-lactamase superfamily domain-containing protein n=1 Tax=Nonomuraea antimicrobica TaxID=561173 RepID=A0ABP7EJS2_9ACTN
MQGMEIRYGGGPTAVLEIGGVRLLTDPTFDAPGDYPIGNRALTKTAGAAFGADEVGSVDVVLLSHDQHPDNLDRAGREYLGDGAVGALYGLCGVADRCARAGAAQLDVCRGGWWRAAGDRGSGAARARRDRAPCRGGDRVRALG